MQDVLPMVAYAEGKQAEAVAAAQAGASQLTTVAQGWIVATRECLAAGSRRKGYLGQPAQQRRPTHASFGLPLGHASALVSLLWQPVIRGHFRHLLLII